MPIMTIGISEGIGGDLQAKEHHPNHEARGWQHHVVATLPPGGTGALYKMNSIIRKEYYVDVLH